MRFGERSVGRMGFYFCCFLGFGDFFIFIRYLFISLMCFVYLLSRLLYICFLGVVEVGIWTRVG